MLWDDAYDMQQDVEFLCTNLSLHELHELAEQVVSAQQSTSDDSCLKLIHERAILARQQEELLQQSAAATLSEEQVKLNAASNNNNRSRPWTREELSALAKAVKKYPPGGASRWDQICLWVNNLCRQADPRTKEECIEQFNLVARGGGGGGGNKNSNNNNSSETVTTTGGDSTTTTTATTDNTGGGGGDSNTDWTQVQDQQLQDALAQFPATMDKNERWSSIAAAVSGKSKKQCVARFKAIREALKKK